MRPLSATYKTVLYAADEGLCGQNVLQSVVNRYCYVIARNQFVYIEEHSNEPLRHCVHCSCLGKVQSLNGQGVEGLTVKVSGICIRHAGLVILGELFISCCT